MTLSMTLFLPRASEAEIAQRITKILQNFTLPDWAMSVDSNADGLAVGINFAHEALSDTADWNATTWDMIPERAAILAEIVQDFYRHSPYGLSLQATWAHETPTKTLTTTIEHLLIDIRQSQLRTSTRYHIPKP